MNKTQRLGLLMFITGVAIMLVDVLIIGFILYLIGGIMFVGGVKEK